MFSFLFSLFIAIVIAACGGGGGSSATVGNTSTGTGSAPSVPTGVFATADNWQATISWSSVSGATSYNIYWSTTSGVTKTSGTKITDATSPYTHTGLTSGTTYYYVVTAVNSVGESSASSQVSATPVAAICAEDQYPGALSVPGAPSESNRMDNIQTDFLKYDNVNFDVFQRTIHNRSITVAIHKNFAMSIDQRSSLSEFVFNTWAIFWKEFGGFAFKSYTVVIGDNLPYSNSGEFGIGFEHSTPFDEIGYKQLYAHGIYHAWNGTAFNGKQWFKEGVTQYYGNRLSGDFSGRWMESEYNSYISAYNEGRDLSLDSIEYAGTENNPYALQYRKGALVAYMLDKELNKTGHHIGGVMKLIYQKYGIGSQGDVTTVQFLSALNELSGKDFTEFFNRYIYGKEKLPVDGSFEWICHK